MTASGRNTYLAQYMELGAGQFLGMMPRIPLFGSLNQIQDAGFDGFEIHAATATRFAQQQIINDVCERDRPYTLHQAWSLVEAGPAHWFNKAFDRLGWLPKEPYALRSHFSDKGRYAPLGYVVYADRWREVKSYSEDPFCLQTCSTRNRDGKPRITYALFLRILRQYRNLNVVLDFTHLRELQQDNPNPGDVTCIPDDKLENFRKIKEFIDFVGVERIAEIHICDCIPSKNLRNIPPWVKGGVIPLEMICGYLVSLRWHGRVVYEVDKKLPRTSDLRKILKAAKSYFGEA